MKMMVDAIRMDVLNAKKIVEKLKSTNRKDAIVLIEMIEKFLSKIDRDLVHLKRKYLFQNSEDDIHLK